MMRAKLCDFMGYGRLSSSSGPVEPENNGVLIIHTTSKDPVHNSIDNGGSGVRMTLRGVERVSGVVKCAGCDCLLEKFKPA